MKKNIYFLQLLLVVVSCSQSKVEGFEISGKILDVSTGNVFLLLRNTTTWQADTLAKSPLINGQFVLKGKVSQPVVAYLRFVSDAEAKDTLGKSFTVKIDATDALIVENKNMSYESGIQGTGFMRRSITGSDLLYQKVIQPENKIENLEKLKDTYLVLYDKAIEQKINGEDKDILNATLAYTRQAYKAFVVAREKYIVDELFSSNDLLYKALIFNNYGIPTSFGIENTKKLQQRLIATYGINNYHTQYVAALIERLNINQSVGVGNKYKNISSLDVEGNVENLASKIGEGKYILLEFWASWCGPCRNEIPNLKQNYAKFHGKGFDIFAISIDKNKMDWKKASNEEQIPWTNTFKMNNKKNKEAQKLYKVAAIPSNFLIDPDGIIVARNLRGTKLTAFLESTFH